MTTFKIVDGQSPEVIGILDRVSPALPYPGRLHHVQVGDFNGDGKADILTEDQRGNWEVGYFDGFQFQRVGFSFEGVDKPKLKTIEQTGHITLANYQQLYISDFNNDGKTDIFYMPLKDVYCKQDHGGFLFLGRHKDVAQNCGTESVPDLNIFYSSGYSFIHETLTNDFTDILDNESGHQIHQFDYWDFYGDGIHDLLRNNISDEAGYQIKYINPMDEEQLLKDVLDGYNNKFSFDYTPMADAAVNENRGALKMSIVFCDSDDEIFQFDLGFPFNSVTFGNRIVKSVHQPNGLSNGLRNSINYKYTDAVYHCEGKGFLGFMGIETINQDQDRRVENRFRIPLNIATIAPYTSETYIHSTNELLSESCNVFVHELRQGIRRYWEYQIQTRVTDYVTHRKTQMTNLYTLSEDDPIDPYGNVPLPPHMQLSQIFNL